MAKQGDQSEELELELLAQFATEIVAAYVTKNAVAMNDLGDLIGIVGGQLRTLGQEAAQSTPVKPGPAVSVRRSIKDDHLVCLVCGRPQKLLRRHLTTHGLTPDAYRELFGLRPDYPMVAPAYRQMRSELALQLGLGRQEKAPPRRRTGR